MNLSERAFDKIVQRAIRRIPEEIRRHLDNMLITVQKRPSEDLIEAMGLPPSDEPLFGLYSGVSLLERAVAEPPLFPDTIYLFQEPLQEACRTIEELEEEIEITVVHEIGHALGISEERLEELGYG